MEKKLQNVIEELRQHHSDEEAAIIEQVFSFFREELEALSPRRHKSNYARLIGIARQYSKRPINPLLIAVFVLHALQDIHPKRVDAILKKIDPRVTPLFKAYTLAHTHLKSSLYNRNMLEHALNTTVQLAELKVDYQTLCAGLLHHLPECSWVTLDDIKRDFGDEIAAIVTQVGKLRVAQISKKKHIATVRHMLLALSKELRALIIKMCGHLDYLNHLDELPPQEKQARAIEALYIYAPLADMLGIWELKWQLEDHAFRHLSPRDYQKIEKRFHAEGKSTRDTHIERTKKMLLREATKAGLSMTISGRLKHFYSIHQKMQGKHKAFNEIYDVFALSIVVPTVDDCYRALGIIHQLWKPKPRRIKDYIACPKNNNYQSLHTTVFGLNNLMTEFQIRTPEMEAESRFGIAAHWYYKHQTDKSPEWINRLLDEHVAAKSDADFFERVDTELIVDKIFVYTPTGDVVSLPKGSTPIDFAYHIHSDIGQRAQGALVNGRDVPLNYELHNEDMVEILIDNTQRYPKPAWLNFVKSDLAKRTISAELEKELLNGKQ